MKNKKEIAELLPNKEDFSLNKAAAASIWVKDFNLGKIASKQLIFGISSSTALSKNFINLKKISYSIIYEKLRNYGNIKKYIIIILSSQFGLTNKESLIIIKIKLISYNLIFIR